MKALVMAGGRGTRLRPLTRDRQKVLVEVSGRPILTYCFETLLSVGVDEIVLAVSYLKDQVMDYYGDSFRGVPITYSVDKEAKGPAHAVLDANEHIENDFILTNGDTVFRANLPEIVENFHTSDGDGLFVVEERADESKLRDVCVTDEDGNVTSILVNPDDLESNVTTTGFAIFPPAIFSALRILSDGNREAYELYDAVEILIDNGYIVETERIDGWRTNINTQDDLEATERLLNC